MSIVSNSFLLLTLTALIACHIVPDRLQWAVLLIFSWTYYLLSGPYMALFLLFSIVLTYTAARGIEKYRAQAKWLMIISVLANFAVLGYLKYSAFVIHTAGTIFHTGWRGANLLVPLGISFYTFQSTGYLLDVYGEKYPAEKKFLHYALFISFFPQLLQGPIGRYDHLAHQFLHPQKNGLHQIVRGLERMLWGFFKKLVIADWAAVFTAAIFDAPEPNPHLALFGALLYTCQLYMDFSGAMDIVIGIAQMFGITLAENFRQPFFAGSVDEFWRRWHITLGEWMRDYVYFPLTLQSSAINRLRMLLRKKFGRKSHLVKALPAMIANLVVFALVGIWHGAGWNYLLYGLFNGVIVAVSVLLKNVYVSWEKALHIDPRSKWFHGFRLVRTWCLTLMWMVMIRSSDMHRAVSMIRHFFTRPQLQALLGIPAGRLGTSYTPAALLTILAGCLVVLLVSIQKERGVHIREQIARLPLPAGAALYLLLLACIGFFGSAAVSGGFIYAQF